MAIDLNDKSKGCKKLDIEKKLEKIRGQVLKRIKSKNQVSFDFL